MPMNRFSQKASINAALRRLNGSLQSSSFGFLPTFLSSSRFNSSGSKDYYKILGVDRNADVQAVKKAYRKRALETHPDSGGNKEEFAEVAEAYEVLSNPEKKQMYEQYGSEAATNPNMARGFQGDRSAEDIFADFFRGSSMGGFADMFGGGGRGTKSAPTIEPIETRVRLTLEDVFKGVTKKVRVSRPQICPDCDGFGTKSKTEKPKCMECRGSGKVVQQQSLGPGMIQQTVSSCHKCRGTGTASKPDDQCIKCQSKGYKNVTQEVSVEIPAGVPSNVTLIVRGEGGRIPGAQPVDLHVHVDVSPHALFKRRGDDLIMDKTLSLSQALLGSNFDVKALDGKVLNVNLSEILKPGGVIKISGEGMPSSSGKRGDIYIFSSISMPTKLSPQQRELLGKAFGVQTPSSSAGTHVKGRVLRETREELEDKKRTAWSQEGQMGGSRPQSHPGGSNRAECSAQ